MREMNVIIVSDFNASFIHCTIWNINSMIFKVFQVIVAAIYLDCLLYKTNYS